MERKEIIEQLQSLGKTLQANKGFETISLTPPSYINQSSIARLENGLLYPKQPATRVISLGELGDILVFIAENMQR